MKSVQAGRILTELRKNTDRLRGEFSNRWADPQRRNDTHYVAVFLSRTDIDALEALLQQLASGKRQS